MKTGRLLTPHWSPLVSFVLLIAACLYPTIADPAGQQIGYLFSHSLYVTYIVVTLGALLVIAWRGRGTPTALRAWWTLDIALCTFLVSQGLKTLTRLPRPSGSPTGFPSGHTLFAFSLAWLMLKVSPRLGPIWFVVAFLIGWSRVEIHDHYAYQVIVGAVFGSIIGWAVSTIEDGLIFPRTVHRWKNRRSRPPSGNPEITHPDITIN